MRAELFGCVSGKKTNNNLRIFIFIILGYVHTNAFSFGFLFGDAKIAQHLNVDTTVFIPFSRIRYVCVFNWIHFRWRFHINAVSPKSLSVLVWTLPFSFRFHEDDVCVFTFESVFTLSDYAYVCG